MNECHTAEPTYVVFHIANQNEVDRNNVSAKAVQ